VGKIEPTGSRDDALEGTQFRVKHRPMIAPVELVAAGCALN
jgi:hypothetical protein